jgi:hypothetical protein
MEQTTIKGFRATTPEQLTGEAAQEISNIGAVFLEGDELQKQDFYTVESYQEFANSWNNLLLDEFMGDNGKYRLRRYSQFNYNQAQGDLELLPHEPYSQPSYINPLNGDIKRYFEPLEDYVVRNEFFNGLLKWAANLFDTIEGQPTQWNIRIHPYRILANTEEQGQPTPEGVHRDGVTYIFMMMIERRNISGGETSLYDANRNKLGDVTLQNPLDIILADDEKSMHGVTAIQAVDPTQPAYRDVLVVAYTKQVEL